MSSSRYPIIALWATPRTVSTAFERMMIERGDHQVFDEPFSAFYYFSGDRPSTRFERTLPDSRPDAILSRLLEAADAGPVFFKDMAYQAGPLLDDAFLANFTNTFLVRDPARALASFASRWPDLTEEEAGYERQWYAFRIAERLSGHPPPVLDSDDVRADPHRTIEAWCAAVDIPFLPDALTWEPGMQPQWDLWPDWYGTVAASTGFEPPSPGPAPGPDDTRLAALVERCRPYYRALHERRLSGPVTARPKVRSARRDPASRDLGAGA